MGEPVAVVGVSRMILQSHYFGEEREHQQLISRIVGAPSALILKIVIIGRETPTMAGYFFGCNNPCMSSHSTNLSIDPEARLVASQI